jgi:hypothetical protein
VPTPKWHVTTAQATSKTQPVSLASNSIKEARSAEFICVAGFAFCGIANFICYIFYSCLRLLYELCGYF